MKCIFTTMGGWFAATAVLLAALVAALAWPSKHQSAGLSAPQPLLIYCAANLRVPLEQIIHDYEAETGVRVNAQYAGSQTMLTNAEISQKGDLFLPADDSYIQLARDKGMIDQTVPIARMHPVLAVLRGNTSNLHNLDDLLRPGIKIAQANPDAAAIGKVTRPVLQTAGLWEKLADHTATFTTTVTEAANALTTRSVDGAIVWDTTVKQIDGLEAIELPIFSGVESHIVMATLKSGRQPAAAMKFAQYAAGADKGRKVFERFGYKPL